MFVWGMLLDNHFISALPQEPRRTPSPPPLVGAENQPLAPQVRPETGGASRFSGQTNSGFQPE
jgi:hypothetical protein